MTTTDATALGGALAEAVGVATGVGVGVRTPVDVARADGDGDAAELATVSGVGDALDGGTYGGPSVGFGVSVTVTTTNGATGGMSAPFRQ